MAVRRRRQGQDNPCIRQRPHCSCAPCKASRLEGNTSPSIQLCSDCKYLKKLYQVITTKLSRSHITFIHNQHHRSLHKKKSRQKNVKHRSVSEIDLPT